MEGYWVVAVVAVGGGAAVQAAGKEGERECEAAETTDNNKTTQECVLPLLLPFPSLRLTFYYRTLSLSLSLSLSLLVQPHSYTVCNLFFSVAILQSIIDILT